MGTRLDDIQPVILVDTREQMPLPIEACETQTVCLSCGDYVIRGFSDWTNPAFLVERKSLGDLAGSLTDPRARAVHEVRRVYAGFPVPSVAH